MKTAMITKRNCVILVPQRQFLHLTGDAAATISATMAGLDLGALRNAINDKASVTGITAVFGSGSSELVLTHGTGKDIRITGFDAATTGNDIYLEALDENGVVLATPDAIKLWMAAPPQPM